MEVWHTSYLTRDRPSFFFLCDGISIQDMINCSFIKLLKYVLNNDWLEKFLMSKGNIRIYEFLYIKFEHSEKGTKFEKIFHFQFDVTHYGQILSRRFFQILCLSQKVQTLL